MSEERIKTAVIPAAGLGTRFLPLTKSQPKEMLPLVNKPIIHHVVEEAIKSGIEDVLIITGRGKSSIEDYFDKSYELEEYLKRRGDDELLKVVQDASNLIDIHYVRQKEPLGLGDAIYKARNYVDGPFAVMLGDDVMESDVPCTRQLIDIFTRYRGNIIAVEELPRDEIQRYGVVAGKQLDEDVLLVSNLVEKPLPESAPSNLGIIGRYVLTPDVFDCIERTPAGLDGEVQLTDALCMLCEKQDVYAYRFQGRRYDVGYMLGYYRTIIEFLLRDEDLKNGILDYLKTRM